MVEFSSFPIVLIGLYTGLCYRTTCDCELFVLMAVCAFVLITAVNRDKSELKQPVDELRKVTNELNVMAQFMNFYKV